MTGLRVWYDMIWYIC